MKRNKTYEMDIKYCEVCGEELSKFTSKDVVLLPKRYEQLSYCSYSCARKSSYEKPATKICLELVNLLPLCRPCHAMTNGDREHWFMVCSGLVRKYESAAEMTAPCM